MMWRSQHAAIRLVEKTPLDEMADCTNAAIRNIFLLKKCEYKPDNKKTYGSHLVDNSWGKTYKGWPTSIELHMGYKRDELRLQMIDRGNRAISGATRISTRSPTRDRHGSLLSTFGSQYSPNREDLRDSSMSPNGRTLGSPIMNSREFEMPSPVRIKVP